MKRKLLLTLLALSAALSTTACSTESGLYLYMEDGSEYYFEK